MDYLERLWAIGCQKRNKANSLRRLVESAQHDAYAGIALTPVATMMPEPKRVDITRTLAT